MWIYKDRLLERRLGLDRRIGFCFDYWLFLHADETYPIWCARPLGMRAVAQAVLDNHSSQQAGIIQKQLKIEAVSASRLALHLPCLPHAPKIEIARQKKGWPDGWLEWCEAISTIDSGTIAAELIERITEALYRSDFYSAAYFMRRLAAELGGDEWTRAELFTQIESLIRGDDFDGSSFKAARLTERLTDLLIVRTNRTFVARFAVAPVRINREILDRTKYSIKLEVNLDDQERRILSGLNISVQAAHPSLAAMTGLAIAQKFLESLRLRYYVVTHVYGQVSITSENPDEAWTLWLPQPFWSKYAHGNRAIARLPPNFQRFTAGLDPRDRSRWYAARWHLSEAFSDWAEDVHSAAARVWQALESFSYFQDGTIFERVPKSLLFPYLNIFPGEAAMFTARRLGRQRSHFQQLYPDKKSDWFYWDPDRYDIKNWLNRVLNSRRGQNYRTWKTPAAPDAVFDRRVGLLQVLHRRIIEPRNENWFERRLISDFALLYGLRNAAVHGGKRLFSARMASYLGRLGAEILLSLMNHTVAGRLTLQQSSSYGFQMDQILQSHFG